MEDWNEDPRTHKESFAMDFYGGDLKGIEDKIPYLKELGVTAIYLNPIFESYSTHKYDCVDYFHVDKHFGGDEALVELSKALHENDMKLVLDISINHTGCANAWTKDKKEFYFKKEDGSLLGWAGFSTLPVLDYRSEELRDLIYRNDDSVLKKWLKEPYNIDGWRFDVADVFARNGEVQLADEVWHEVCKAIRDVNKDAIIIGEHWADCAEYLQGDLWNTPMNYYGFGRIIRQFAGLPDLFLMRNEAFLKVDYEMSASDVINRTDSHYSSIPQVLADTQMNLFDSHDIARLHNHDSITFAKWKSAVLAQLLWTGIPCIHYGDELAIDGYTEHDSGFRYPMPWGKDDENSRLHFNLYSRMTKLRREIDAFSEGGRKVLFADGKVLAIARFMDDEKYVGIISMENEDRTIDIPVWTIGAKDAITESFGIDSEDLSCEAEAFSYNTDIEKMTEKVDAFGEHFMCGAENGILKINVPAFASYIFKVR